MSQKHQFVAAHAQEYPVTPMCRVRGLAWSGFYAWQRRSESVHSQREQEIAAQIQRVFAASRLTSGSPRVHAELQAEGVHCARTRVARLMRTHALVARARRRRVRTTDSRHEQPVAPKLLEGSFQAAAPNRI